MSESILTQQQGVILEITLNRPEAYNALNLDMMVMLSDVLASAATDDSIKGIMITGKGKAFCSGGDLKWMSQQAVNASSTLHKLAPQFHVAITEIRRMPKPVVAAINGIAAGGGFSLALACALEIASFDQPISSAQALDWGLVTKVVPDDKLIEETISMFQRLANSSLHSFAWSKRLLSDSFNNTLETQLELERQGISDCARHPDGQEGIKAFVEKRKPVF
jgi:2-(1,2-epoxy-1,2-dihydrophenyl)acetyl-CoA isomerase